MNPKNISVMTLRSGKEVEGPGLMTPIDKNKERIKKNFEKEGIGSVKPDVILDFIIKVRTNPFLTGWRN